VRGDRSAARGPRLGGDPEDVELERQFRERIARHDLGEIAVDAISIMP